jgi:hypothetical protein
MIMKILENLCIVVHTDNKRALLTEMYMQIESNRPLDLILYTPEEWSQVTDETGTFAHMIIQKGEEIYGRQ